jgi:hypothetical protein
VGTCEQSHKVLERCHHCKDTGEFRKDLFRVKRSYWYFLPKFPEQLEETEITCRFHLAQMDNVPDLLQNKVPMRLHSCPAGFIIAVNLL